MKEVKNIKKEKIAPYLIYNITSLSKTAGKTEPFSGKISSLVWNYFKWC